MRNIAIISQFFMNNKEFLAKFQSIRNKLSAIKIKLKLKSIGRFIKIKKKLNFNNTIQQDIFRACEGDLNIFIFIEWNPNKNKLILNFQNKNHLIPITNKKTFVEEENKLLTIFEHHLKYSLIYQLKQLNNKKKPDQYSRKNIKTGSFINKRNN